MGSAPGPQYRFQGCVVDRLAGSVTCHGEERHLRQQTLDVLLYLLDHRHRIVSKEELFQRIWPETAVSDDALVQCIVEIRKALGDPSRASQIIKTVPRRGYRFVGPVEILEAQVANSAPPAGAPQPPASAVAPPAGPGRGLAAGLSVAALVAIVLFALLANSPSGIRPETKLSPAPGVRKVIVLLFDNQSGSREFAWLREGLPDMVITGLSRFEGLAVLSRKQLDLLLVRNDLDPHQSIDLESALKLSRASAADAIVMGTFAEVGGKVRFEATLVDASTGRLLGAETALAERPDEVLTQVDVVALGIARRLGVRSANRDDVGRLSDVLTNSLEAYHYYSLGLQKSNALESVEGVALFQKAIEVDPDFAMAHARIGYTYAMTQSLTERAKPHLQRAFELSDRLTDKDRLNIAAWYAIANSDYDEAITRLEAIVSRYPLEVEAYWRLGTLLQSEGRTEEARTVLRRGLTADPENKDIVNALGTLYQVLGRHQDAIAMHRRYVELAPKEPNAHDSLGLTYQYAGMYEAAIEAYGRAIALDPEFEIAVVHLGNTFYQLGRYREAIDQYQRYLTVADFERDRGRGHAAIALVLWRQGRVAAARTHADRSMRLQGRPAPESILLALARRDLAEARTLLKDWRRPVSRGSAVSQRVDECVRGELALAEGRGAEAIDHFRAALTHPPVPFSSEAYDDCLASGLSRLDRLDEAIAEYRRILGINPNFARARYELAQALERKGRGAEAREEYVHALRVWAKADGDVPEVVRARSRMRSLPIE